MALKAGDIDLMVDVAYSAERDRQFDFNRNVVLSSWSVVYVQDHTRVTSLLDLDGKRVGVLAQSIQQADLRQRAEAFSVRPMYVSVESFTMAFEQWEAGMLDAVVVNRFVGQEAESQYAIEPTPILLHPSQ